jgi:DNA replication protein DnaC
MAGFNHLRALRGGYEECASSTRCDLHGDFQQRVFIQDGVEVGRIPASCPVCRAEIEQRRESEERERSLREAIATRLTGIKIPPRFVGAEFANYDPSENPDPFAKVQSYAERWPSQLKTGESLILIGTIGTGKTHLVIALCKAVARQRFSARYCTVLNLLREVRATWRKPSVHSEAEVVGHFSGVHLLALDEIGAQYATEGERVLLFDIINARYERMLPTVVVGNATIQEIEHCLDQRSVDRLRENGGRALVFQGKSRRRAA